MVGKTTLLLLAVLVGVAWAQSCSFGNLDFNPWDRWNVFVFNDIGSAANPYGADFEGRAAAGGSMYLDEFTLRAISGGSSDTTAWSATVGQNFLLIKGDVKYGGVEAGVNFEIGQGSVQGDATAVAGTLTVGAGAIVTGKANAQAGKFDIQGTVQQGQNPSNPSLSVNLDDVKDYFVAASAAYAALDEVTGTVAIDQNTNGIITVTLVAGLNVLRLTNAQLENAGNLILLGDSTGYLVINVDAVSASLTNLDVWTDAGMSTHPTSGRVLINYHAATSLAMGPISAFASILAPNADLSYWTGVITGNVVVKSLSAADASGTGAQINIQRWVDCPAPPAPAPAPGTTGEIPSPPEECPPCPWEELGFNPWDLWNVFSLSNVGSSAKPFAADFQGRLAAVGSAWLKSFSLHDIAQAATTAWSATVGGEFHLNGGSVSNGGVEAGGNVEITAADVAGNVYSVGGNIVLGTAVSSATVGGMARAAGTVDFFGGSSALGGYVEGDNSLSLSVDLTAVANWFKAQSLAYAAESDNVVTVTYDPNAANPVDITVELGAGFNYLTLTAAQLLGANRLQITGDATGVLVINVAGTTVQFDNLDVTVDNWDDVPSWGRVLINFYEATSLTVVSGHGHASILAPLADVVYQSGLFTGNWVVGSLVSQWEGGTQINVQPWTPPCPPCPTDEPIGLGSKTKQTLKKTIKAAAKKSQKKTAAFKAPRRVNIQSNAQAAQTQFSQQHGVPQWALILGGGVAGIALSALVVAGIALRKLSNLPRAVGRKGGIVPATPSQANIFSPQSTSSLSHRGRGQFPTSP